MQGFVEHPRSNRKAALRTHLRAARAGMAPTARAVEAVGLRRVVTEFLVAGQDRDVGGPGASPSGAPGRTAPGGVPVAVRGTVAGFIGVGAEPDTGPLLASLHAAGFDVVVPVCEPGYVLSWASWWPGVPLARSVRAPVDEPTGPRRFFEGLTDVRLVLVPALGVDPSGARLGQGGGYYDRFLAGHPFDRGGGRVPAMAPVYRSEVLPVGAVPVGPFDRPIDGAFTADGPLIFGSAPSRV